VTTTAWLALALCAVLCTGVTPPARLAALAAAARLATAGPRRPDLRWRPVGPVPVAAVCGAGLVAAGLWRGGVALGVGAAAVGGLAVVLARDRCAQRERTRRHTDLVGAVQVLVAELESGSRPAAALQAAGCAGPAHRPVFANSAALAASGGDASVPLLADLTTRAVGVAWQLGQETGLALTAVLARVAADLTAQADQHRAVAVALAGPRSSAAVLTGLPMVGVALGLAMGAHPIGFLVDSPAGRLVCCAGVLLDVAGVLWVRRIVRTAGRA
jgi:tight adherence protein B